jgi:micrococcal nuclease
MRRSIAVTVLATMVACTSAGQAAAPDRSDVVPVLKVTDGDTFHVLYRGQDERVRLIGIDTPEVPWYGGDEECFGVEAGLYARERLDGKWVRLEFDVARRDRYDRLLAYVYLGGELFNLTLVRRGYATSQSVPPNVGFAAEFEAGEVEARIAKVGLWSNCRDA